MEKPEVTIIVPNYKTPVLTRLCLRSLKKHTNPERVRVIVIDNGSADESLAYLRTVEWITLVERSTGSETGPEMHARALDLGLSMTDTPLVMVIHTDTIVINDLWLDFLVNRFHEDPQNGGIGSWKLETVSRWKCFGKKIETLVRRLLGRKVKNEYRYFRSHCALYSTEAVKHETEGFFDGDTAGCSLFRMLSEKGYHMPFLESQELSKFIRHLNHATMILNPAPGDRKTATPAARIHLEKELESLGCNQILADDTLDKK